MRLIVSLVTGFSGVWPARWENLIFGRKGRERDGTGCRRHQGIRTQPTRRTARGDRVLMAWRGLRCLLVLWLLLGLLFPLAALAEDARPTVDYFYENYCDACHPEEDFREEFRYLSGRDLSEFQYTGHNVVDKHARAAFDETMERLKVPQEQRLLPFVSMETHWYAGSTQIRAAMPRDFVAGDDTASLIYYLYITACESCAAARAVLDALPATMEVTRGAYTFVSPIKVLSVDIGGDPGLAQSLFDHYDVPQNKRTAPIVFLRDTYLGGAEAIARSLTFRLGRGDAVGTMAAKPAQADLGALSVISAIGAGLVGGLNPCALGMLLFFLTVLLSMNRRPGIFAAVYLGVKFLTYLAIGTVFYSVFRMWNPQWLPQALKVVLTLAGLALIALNVWDALALLRQEHGKVKNQLPQRARQYLHDRMRGILTGGSRALWVSTALVAALTAGAEFLCAGQVYLATLLAGIASGTEPARMYGMLVSYCLAFLVPSAALAFAAARGKTLPRLAAWLNDRMQATKWLTAALFVIVLVIIWL